MQATKVEGTTQVTIKTRTLSLDERQELEDTLAENCDVDASPSHVSVLPSVVRCVPMPFAVIVSVSLCYFTSGSVLISARSLHWFMTFLL